MNYLKKLNEVFTKHGSGATDLASEIIHLEEEKTELLELVNLLTIEETSDSGRNFHPNTINSCRCMDGEKIDFILNKYKSQ
jgi:hypothetical protein